MRNPLDTDHAVVVLDLRDNHDAGRQARDLSGRILVIDNAIGLVGHSEVYLTLVEERQTSGVICLAIGQLDDPDDGVVLRHPAALTHGGGVLLWAGDPQGLRWSPTEDRARPVPAAQPSSLDQLISALCVEEVFDRVVELLRELPYRTANPGFRLATGIVDPAEFAAAGRESIKLLTDDSAHPPTSTSSGPAARPAGAHRTASAVAAGSAAAAVPGSDLDRHRADAIAQLNEADQTSSLLGTGRGLVGSDLPGRVVGQRFMQAGRSAADYRNLLDVLFSRMDGNLLSGDPPVEAVTAVGVDAPVAVRRRDVVTQVRDYVQDRLTRDRSLAMLVPALRQEAAAADPQGCAAALHRLADLGPLQRPLPAFTPWPLPRAVLPLVFLTCALGTLAPSESWMRWLVGGGLALAWFLAGWVMLARRPKENGEHGFGTTALPAFLFYGSPGVLGVVAGLVGAAFVTVPSLVGQVLMVASVLVLVTTVSLSWPRAARRWKDELDLSGLRHRVDQMSAVLADTLTAQWGPSEQRRVVADTLREVGAGLEQIAGALPEACAELFTPPERRDPVDLFALSPSATQPVQPEVLDVVVTDLVELARAALEPCWQAIESNIRPEPHLYSWRVRTLVEEYRNHIARNGLLAAPIFVTNPKPREVLAARVWTDSAEALAALESRIDDEMTQLCRSKQLNLISTSAGDIGVLRFAPHQLKQVREFGNSGR
ncbi:MAG: hypothetical protein LC799_02825, partial [Actinobacteria bacterium]|nr:hypothetical protein [Actinomycetota bacterium]